MTWLQAARRKAVLRSWICASLTRSFDLMSEWQVRRTAQPSTKCRSASCERSYVLVHGMRESIAYGRTALCRWGSSDQ